MQFTQPDPLDILNALGLSTPLALEPVHGGADSRVWRIRHSSGTYALRVFTGQGPCDYEQEARVMKTAAARGVPVPQVHAVKNFDGRSALLLSWCAGFTVKRELLRRPWRAQPLGLMCGSMLAAIHAVAPPPALQHPSRSWTSWLAPEDSSLGLRLEELGGQCDDLLHLDYHPLNLMTDGRRITGVLDWTNAHRGDPRADIARTVTILRLDAGTIDSSFPRKLLTQTILRRFERGFLHGYQRVAGPIGDLAPFYAWAGALMKHDLGHRYSPAQLAHVDAWTDRWRERMTV